MFEEAGALHTIQVPPSPRRWAAVPVDVRERGRCAWGEVRGESLHPPNRALMSGPWELFRPPAGPDTHPRPFRLGDSQSRERMRRAVLPAASDRAGCGQWRCHTAVCLGSLVQCLLSTDSVPGSFGHQGRSRDSMKTELLPLRSLHSRTRLKLNPWLV